MKKVFGIFLSVILILTVGYYFFAYILINSNDTNNDVRLNIVTSFYPMYIATSNIVDGVENITLSNLTNTEVGCLHDYQLTTENMIKLEEADIFVVNGGGMENFIDKAVKNHKDLEIVNASEGILSDEWDEETQNSHIWVSVSDYIKQVENIKNRLCALDKANEKKYEENAKEYIKKLGQLKSQMHEKLDEIENKNIITFHEAFYYFAKEFDFNVVAVIEREPGTSPSSGEIAEIIETIKNTNAKAIFVEPQYERTAADAISKETGVAIYTLDPIVTGDLNKEAYINVMNKNLNTLVEALDDGK